MRSAALDPSEMAQPRSTRSQPPAWLHGLGLLAALLVLAAIVSCFLLVFAEIARRVNELGRPGTLVEAPGADDPH